jgi:hypothetical protein
MPEIRSLAAAPQTAVRASYLDHMTLWTQHCLTGSPSVSWYSVQVGKPRAGKFFRIVLSSVNSFLKVPRQRTAALISNINIAMLPHIPTRLSRWLAAVTVYRSFRVRGALTIELG